MIVAGAAPGGGESHGRVKTYRREVRFAHFQEPGGSFRGRREFGFHQGAGDALAAICWIDRERENLAFGMLGLTGLHVARRYLARDYESLRPCDPRG